ncbi:MAG: PKD domain-containing protein [Methanomicrobiales archaeon]|nr:PKD domain-containing protein [Methanomicrobiales archaeon]
MRLILICVVILIAAVSLSNAAESRDIIENQASGQSVTTQQDFSPDNPGSSTSDDPIRGIALGGTTLRGTAGNSSGRPDLSGFVVETSTPLIYNSTMSEENLTELKERVRSFIALPPNSSGSIANPYEGFIVATSTPVPTEVPEMRENATGLYEPGGGPDQTPTGNSYLQNSQMRDIEQRTGISETPPPGDSQETAENITLMEGRFRASLGSSPNTMSVPGSPPAGFVIVTSTLPALTPVQTKREQAVMRAQGRTLHSQPPASPGSSFSPGKGFSVVTDTTATTVAKAVVQNYKRTVQTNRSVRIPTSQPLSGSNTRNQSRNGTLVKSTNSLNNGTVEKTSKSSTGNITKARQPAPSSGSKEQTSNISRKSAGYFSITYDETVSGTLSGPDGPDNYDFTGNYGDRILCRIQKDGGDILPRLSLIKDGNSLTESNDWGLYASYAEFEYQLPEDGTYSLQLDDPDLSYTGSYSLSLTQIHPHSSISYGDTLPGVFTSPLQLELYSFWGNDRDNVRFWLNSGFAELRLYSPSGDRMNIEDPTNLSESGEYILCVAMLPQNVPGSYDIYLELLPPPTPTQYIPITYNQTLAGSLKYREPGGYSFNGTAGEMIYARLRADWAWTPVFSLFDKNNEFLYGGSSYDHYGFSYLLTENSTYYLTVEANGQDDGVNYWVYLTCLNPPPDAIPIEYGQVLDGVLSNASQLAAFSFEGRTGERLLARLQADWASTPMLSLIDKSGNFLWETSTFGPNGIGYFSELPDNGTYYLTVDDAEQDNAGNFSVSLTCVNPPTNATSIQYGQIVSGNCTRPLEYIPYAFTVQAGDSLRFWLKSDCSTLHLFTPAGLEVSITDPIILSTSGTYHLIVTMKPNTPPGAYAFYLESVNRPSTVTPISYHQTTSGSLNATLDMDVYSFTGAIGDLVIVNLEATPTGSHPRVSLYGPDGNYLTTAWANSSVGMNYQIPLPTFMPQNESGTYYLTVDDRYTDHMFSYTLSLTDTNFVYGQELDAKLTTVWPNWDFDTYAFQGNEGDIVFAQITGDYQFWVPGWMYRFDGLIFSLCSSNDSVGYANNLVWNEYQDLYLCTYELTCKLPKTGTYHLKVWDQDYDKIGNYTIYLTRLNPPLNATPIEYGQNVTGDTTRWIGTTFYSFNAAPNDSVRIVGTFPAGGFRLFSSDGKSMNYCSSDSLHIIPISAPGTCYIAVASRGFTHYSYPPPNHYQFSVESLTRPLNSTIITYNQTIQSTFSGTGTDWKIFSFNGSGGDRVIARAKNKFGSWVRLVIYSENGTILNYKDGQDPPYATEFSMTLPKTGLYFLLVDGGNYHDQDPLTLHLSKLNPPITVKTVQYGEIISGAGTIDLEMVPYAFEAQRGDAVRVWFQSGCSEARLYSPEGFQISLGNPTILPSSGIYYLIVAMKPNGGPGPFSFRIESVNSPDSSMPIRYNQTISRQINSTVKWEAFRFNATAGEKIAARLQANWQYSPRLSLFSPNGSVIQSASGQWSTEIYKVLNETGTYYLMVDDLEQDSYGSYSLFLTSLNPPPSVNPAQYGQVISGTCTRPLEVLFSSFNGVTGDSLRFWKNSTCTDLLLYTANGTAVAITDPTILPSAGTYYVGVTMRPNIQPGPYAFYIESLQDVQNSVAQQLVPGKALNRTISTQPWDTYWVEIPSGGNLLVQATRENVVHRLKIYAAYNRIPTDTSYDFVQTIPGTQGNYDLLFPSQTQGRYFIRIYGSDFSGSLPYTILASLPGDTYISTTYPSVLNPVSPAILNVYGLGFQNGMRVQLTKNNITINEADSVFLGSPTTLVSSFNLIHIPEGTYDLNVIWPGGSKEALLPSMVTVRNLSPEILLEVPDVNLSAWETKNYPLTVPSCPNLFISLQKVNFPGHDTHNGWAGNLSLIRNGEVVAFDRSDPTAVVISGGGGGGAVANPIFGYTDQDLFIQIVNPDPGEYTIRVNSYESQWVGYQGGGTGVLAARTSLPALPEDQWVVATIHRNWGSSFHQVTVKPGTTALRIDTESTGDWSSFRLYKERYKVNRNEFGGKTSWSCFGGPTSNFTLLNPDPGLYIMEFVDTGGYSAYGVNGLDHYIVGDRDLLLKATMSGQSDPPIRYFPTVSRFTPRTGGNSGPTTLVITGRWLDPDAVVTLTGSDNTLIPAMDVSGSSDNTTLVAQFNLQGRAPGDYTLLVTNPDGSTVNGPFLFTLEEGGRSEFWARIVGREAIRTGKPATYRLEYGNRGSIDMQAIPVGISSEAGSMQVRFTGSDLWKSTDTEPIVLAEGPASSPQVLPAGFSSSIEFQVKTEEDGSNILTAIPYNHEPIEPSDVAYRTDAYCPETGLALDFSSFYPATASSYVGPFGYGWIHSYDIRLQKFEYGQFGILNGNQYLDILSRSPDGKYSGQSGYPTLTRNPDQSSILTYPDKSIIKFRADGLLDYYQDLNDNRISFEHSMGRLTTVRHSSGDIFSFEYLPSGRISQINDQANRVTRYSYDPNGTDLISVTRSDGTSIEYSYEIQNGLHALAQLEYPGSIQKKFTYDGKGVLREVTTNDQKETLSLSHDTKNLTTTVTDLAGSWISIHKNDYGRLKTVQDSIGASFSIKYDKDNYPESLIGPLGETTRYESDDLGNIIRVVNPLNGVTTFTYDNQFNALSSAGNPRGSLVRFIYNSKGNLATATYQDDSVENFGYDSSGNIIQFTTRNGATIHYTYNLQGQLTRKDFPDGTYAAYSYDNLGNLISAVDVNGTVSLSYDISNRLTGVTYPGGYSQTYTYNDAGQLTQRTEQDGFSLKYIYTDTGRIARVTDGSDNLVAEYSYDNAGKLTRKGLGSGAYSTYQYNGAGQVIRQVNYNPTNTEISDFVLSYDLSGNLISLNTAEGQFLYEYDASGQLTKIIWPDGHSSTYTYDAAGNRISMADAGNTTHYTTNIMDQYTTIGIDALSYDQNGNLIAVSSGGSPVQTTQYTYGYENQLLAITSPDGTWEYQYDALGNRVGMIHNGTVIHYEVNPLGMGEVTAEYDASGHIVTRYLYGDGLLAREDPAGNRSYYHFTPTGHTSEITTSTGMVVNQYTYTPFGEYRQKVEGIANPFKYVGEYGVMDDGTGLFHMKKRFYDPVYGRFTSVDPVYQPGGNPYTYCQNNPVIKIDPKGRFYWFLAIAAGAGYGAYKAYGWVKDWLEKKEVAKLPDKVDVAIEVVKNFGDPDVLRPGTPKSPNPLGPLVDVPLQFLTFPTGLGDNKKEQEGNLINYYNGWKILVNPDKYTRNMDEKIYQNINGRQSRDPEDKYGPQGFDTSSTLPGDLQRFITGTEPLEYQAYFWNHENATAPVCDVDVYDTMDPDLDVSSFRFIEVGFSDWRVSLEPCQFFTVYVDTRPQMNYTIRIIGIFNQTTGQANLKYNTLDPDTLIAPEDPLAGFLPPITESGKEIGWFNYHIMPLGTPPTGTVIENQAFINFDSTQFLPGPKDAPWKNTIDAGPPASTLTATLTGENQVQFTATLGDDTGGSGVRDYTVYASDNGGEYRPLLNRVTGTVQQVTGVPGHTYEYYSIATDNVGNVEPSKLSPDGAITVPILVTADFSGSPRSGAVPLTVNFTDLSGGTPTGWEWSFGDGSAKETVQKPSHMYLMPGNYTVSLIARKSGSESTESRENYIHVTETATYQGTASFTVNRTVGNVPLTVLFNDTSTGGPLTSWNWSFGDSTWSNITDAARRNVTHTYTLPGSYTARLTVGSAGGMNTTDPGTIITVISMTAPNVTSINPATGVSGTTVSVTNLSGLNFRSTTKVNLTRSGYPDISATSVRNSSSTKITCTFNLGGATAGPWNIMVINPDGQSGMLQNGFLVTGKNLTLTGITPVSGYRNSTVSFSLPKPTVATISPAFGYRNTTVSFTLTGTSFKPGATVVNFTNSTYPGGNLTTTISSVTATKITGNVIIPYNAPWGKWNIVVTTPDGGTVTKIGAFTVNPWPKPTISAVSPASGYRNTTVLFTLTGTSFQDGTVINFYNSTYPGGNLTTSLSSIRPTKIMGNVFIPAYAPSGKWNIVVITPDGGTGTKSGAFTVNRWPKPMISSITPTTGTNATTVSFTLNGNYFQTGSVVNLTNTTAGNLTASVTSATLTQIKGTVWIPGGRKGAYGLEVTTPDGGVASVANKFTVK